MRKRGTHVGYAEPVHEQLGELEHVCVAVVLAHGPDARRRGGDDDVVVAEDRREPAGERVGFLDIAAVQVQLPAAGLLGRDDDLVAEPFEDPHRGA